MRFLATTLHLYLSASAALMPANASATDESLMQAFVSGDSAAFEVLYTRHRAPFWRYLTRLVGNSARGEELFQDAWQRVLTARESYSPDAPFRAWLYRIGHNLAIDGMRREKLAPESALDDTVLQFPGPSETEPEQRVLSQDQHQALMQALEALPPEQRDVVLLKAEGDLTLEQIGELTGHGRETVKSRLRYALSKMKQALS
jgi:RNA polymerase sigma factor (sigma-70 family)